MKPAVSGDDQRMALNYLRCLATAMDKTYELLSREDVSCDEIHAIKSVLYAAIERTGMRADRFLSVQRKLRELVCLVGMLGDTRRYERLTGLQILEELRTRYVSETLKFPE